MSGIYIHIPYCKQACYYCDFHFSTNLSTKSDLIEAILREITSRKNYLGSDPVQTIYFGGGTPSLLTRGELEIITHCIYDHFNVVDAPEITLEANPDDLNAAKIADLKNTDINRLSIGIQSFDDKLLKYFNRAHNSAMATSCVEKAKTAGFNNISTDLIFGAPDQSIDELKSDLNQLIDLDIPHVSIYGLTIEKDTVFGKWFDQKKLWPLDDEISAAHLELIMRTLDGQGYEQYEISNFCRPGYESKHNSSYWHGEKYLGIGPAAHSYDGQSRQFNVANNIKYIKNLKSHALPYTIEHLSREDKINEFILTQIRLNKGIDRQFLKEKYSFDIFEIKSAEIRSFENLDMVEIAGEHLRLSSKGKLLADLITEKLII